MQNNTTITIVEYDYLQYSDASKNNFLTKKEFDAIKEFVLKNEKYNKSQFLKLTTKDKKEVLQAQQYIGIIKLKNGRTIEILPKITGLFNNTEDIQNDKSIDKIKVILLKMLKTLRDFPFKNFQLGDLQTTKMPLFEIFIEMFLTEVDKLVKKGIKSNYTVVDENQKFLKGKLILPKQLKHNFIHKERFFISYDNYLPNRIENRIIKTCLLKLYKLSNSTQNKKIIRKFIFIFNEIDPAPYNKIKDYYKNFSLDRTLNYYKLVMLWSKVFLFEESFTPFKGKEIAFALLFDMNKLFESYVGNYIYKNYSRNWDIKLQDNRYYIFENSKKFKLKPDIVLRRKEKKNNNIEIIIADTKWKTVFEEKDLSQQDLYQVFAYASKYNLNNENCKKVFLIYPYHNTSDNLIELTYETAICNKNNLCKISLLFFDLVKDEFYKTPL